MKKFISAIFFIFVFASLSECATSDDVNLYVINAKLDMILEIQKNQAEELKVQRNEISELKKSVAVLEAKLGGRIDSVEMRMSELRNGFYLACVILGIILGLPIFNKLYEKKKEYEVEKLVERLIEAKLNARLQTQ